MGLTQNQFSNTSSNFDASFSISDGYIVIEPAPIEVDTPNDTKTYDGYPLPETTDQPMIIGLVNDEEVENIECLPNQVTEYNGPDGTPNQYKITWGTAKESNYKIVTQKLGTLLINRLPVKITIVDTSDGYVLNVDCSIPPISVSKLEGDENKWRATWSWGMYFDVTIDNYGNWKATHVSNSIYVTDH